MYVCMSVFSDQLNNLLANILVFGVTSYLWMSILVSQAPRGERYQVGKAFYWRSYGASRLNEMMGIFIMFCGEICVSNFCFKTT